MHSSSKRNTAFLFLSLVANAALGIALLLQPKAITSAPSPAGSTSTDKNLSPLAHSSKAVIDALGSGNDEAMRAAGVPLDVIHRLAAARAYLRLRDLNPERKAAEANDGKYWRATTPLLPKVTAKQRAEQDAERNQAEQELHDACEPRLATIHVFRESRKSATLFCRRRLASA